MSESLLKGKTAIVTGTNRGIGKAILTQFALNGANVVACARKADPVFSDFLKELTDKTGVKISPVYFDLSHENSVKEAARGILSEFKTIDVLVNNAGVIHTALFSMTSIEKIKETFEVNFFSQLLFTQYIAKRMMQQKSGSIVNLSSSAAIEANEGRIAYSSSKAALICASKTLAKELSPWNIRVNVVAPGLIETDMMRESTPKEVLETTLKRLALKRTGTPLEIANSVLFLASDLSSYITGQVLSVNGGM